MAWLGDVSCGARLTLSMQDKRVVSERIAADVSANKSVVEEEVCLVHRGRALPCVCALTFVLLSDRESEHRSSRVRENCS